MSLRLDPRHRAMLAEMKVPLWWPGTPVALQPAPQPATSPVLIARNDHPKRTQADFESELPPGAAPAGDPAGTGIAALDWPALRQAVTDCRRCSLCQTRQHAVFGVGPGVDATHAPPRVDWLIVGEAPGENEDLQGEPFVGQAGKLLDNMLRAAGLSRSGREQVGGVTLRPAYIANLIKCRPPGNRNPEPEEILRCQPYLQRQIALLQPRLILALGRFAAHALLADTVAQVHTLPLGKLRGRVHRHQGLPVVVSYHPAYLLRNLPDKAKAWEDLCLALDAAAHG